MIKLNFSKKKNYNFLRSFTWPISHFILTYRSKNLLFYDLKLRITVTRQDFRKIKIRGQIRNQHQKLPYICHFQKQSMTKRALIIFGALIPTLARSLQKADLKPALQKISSHQKRVTENKKRKGSSLIFSQNSSFRKKISPLSTSVANSTIININFHYHY